MIRLLVYGFKTDLQEALGLGICEDCDSPFFLKGGDLEFLCERCNDSLAPKPKERTR
jgi:hypothetical protein